MRTLNERIKEAGGFMAYMSGLPEWEIVDQTLGYGIVEGINVICGEQELARNYVYNLIFNEAMRLQKEDKEHLVLFYSYEKAKRFVIEQLLKIGMGKGLTREQAIHVMTQIALIDEMDFYMEYLLEGTKQFSEKYSTVFIDMFRSLWYKDNKGLTDTESIEHRIVCDLNEMTNSLNLKLVLVNEFELCSVSEPEDMSIDVTYCEELSWATEKCLGLFKERDDVFAKLLKFRSGKSGKTATYHYDCKTGIFTR